MTSKPNHQVPHRAATWGMLLFLASLSVLFAASLVAYFFIRIAGPNSELLPVIALPPVLWVSTLLMVASSIAMSAALRAVRREQLSLLGRYLSLSLGLTAAFVAVQAPAMLQLLASYRSLQLSGGRIYGLVFFLVLLHALHVVGGIIALVRVEIGVNQGMFDHEQHLAIRNAVWYWHFLDIVWLVMFLSLWSVG